jgi:hypothetical protein
MLCRNLLLQSSKQFYIDLASGNFAFFFLAKRFAHASSLTYMPHSQPIASFRIGAVPLRLLVSSGA